MEENLVKLNIDDDEEVVLEIPITEESESSFDLCLVGRFFTTSVIQFHAMWNTLANIWHPNGGVAIPNLGKK
ncbi:hypothetical protein Golob_001085, partial [Gossypium lobatum]|nr:hypothetical protein [Gossypium lobatum]